METPEILETHYPSTNKTVLEIFDEAEIDYYYDDREKLWVIDDISSGTPGYGKLLTAEFVKRVGPDQNVMAPTVIEEETRKRLAAEGLFDQVEKHKKPVLIDDENLLNQLKIVRVFTGGGIKVSKLVITPLEENSFADRRNVSVALYGHT